MPPRQNKPPPLAVRLPDLPTVPDPWKGSVYVLLTLLTMGDANPKLRRSNAAGTPFKTWGLALAPATESGFQLCSSSSAGCRAGCLFRQGHARLDSGVVACRLARTVAWKSHRDWFEERLVYELGRLDRRAGADGTRVAVRLNLTSDVMFEREFPQLFGLYRDISFYDYTKHYPRMMRFLADELPGNYSLTFSLSERNERPARNVLDAGGSVVVVFRDRNFPAQFLGHPVIDGDEHDLRFLDPEGVVVALSAKGTAKHDETGFVVDTDTSRRHLPLLT